MELYQLTVSEKGSHEEQWVRSAKILSDVLFDNKSVAFESLLRSYLIMLDNIKSYDSICSIKMHQDNGSRYDKDGSYHWKIEYGFFDSSDKYTCEFHLRQVGVQKDAQSSLKDLQAIVAKEQPSVPTESTHTENKPVQQASGCMNAGSGFMNTGPQFMNPTNQCIVLSNDDLPF